MLDYEKVEKLAAQWSREKDLTTQQRTLATNLSDLAGILVDPGYGCPTEHEAAETMFRHLNQVIACRQGVSQEKNVQSSHLFQAAVSSSGNAGQP